MGSHRSSTVPWASALVASVALLAGCPTVDLGDTPSDIGLCNPAGGIDYFTDMIWPNFVRPTDTAKGCTKSGGCHNEAGGNALSFRTQGDNFAFNYRQTQIYLNCGQPGASELLTKPIGGMVFHGGSDIFQPGEPQVQIFLDWFM